MTSPTSFHALDRVLDSWPDWGLGLCDVPRVIAKVPGGLTNRNYRLRAPGQDHDLLLRLNHPDPARLGIDRGTEHMILDEVARRGIGRPVAYRDPSDRFVVFPWVQARPWNRGDLADPAQRALLWPLLESLAGVSLPIARRSYHAYLDHYWRGLERHGRVDAALEKSWLEFEPRLCDFDHSGWTACLTHHDLVPANILDTGERLVLIDWEYAAFGHPDIDRWTIDPDAVADPFIAEMMGWINALWARLAANPCGV